MSNSRYQYLSNTGIKLIRSRFSWRTTCFSIRQALVSTGARESITLLAKISPDREKTFKSSRPRRVVARNLRRSATLIAHFADKLEENGLEAAFTAACQLVGPYLRSRLRCFLRVFLVIPLSRGSRTAAVSPKVLIERRKGTLFIGYVEGGLGLGETLRSDLLAATMARIPFAVYPFRTGVETRLIGSFMAERYDESHAYDVNIIEVAPDQAPVVFRSLAPGLYCDSYNVLRTFWELPNAPGAWRQMLTNIDEIWAPNNFVADAFRKIFSRPITIVPAIVDVGNGPHPARGHFGMISGRFYFLFSFDYFSSPYRKNPLAVLEAFQRAFRNRKENVGLIMKSIGAKDHFPEIKEAMRRAMLEDPRIQVIDCRLSRDEILGLIKSADAYVSLHRAEGFGAGMAEALSFGRIVIGTGYSGNAEFLTEETGFPVPYTLRAVQPHEYAWTEGQVWAEPDVDAAAEMMRQAFERTDLALQRAMAGQTLVRSKYGSANVGAVIKTRLAEISDSLEFRPP
jgi:glycosyltransferase involved in cell wall biosynthesis